MFHRLKALTISSVLAALLGLLAACGASEAPVGGKKVAPDVYQVGRITHPIITESSGIVASRSQPDVFWTHTDGGGRKQVLVGINRTGASLAEYRVVGVHLTDWEDIDIDSHGHIFIGDVGNNDARRREIFVHQVDEPQLSKGRSGVVNPTRTWRLRFPSKAFDCESLFVWEDFGYVISKVFNDEKAELYRFSLTNSASFQTLEPVTKLKIDSPVTGATISADGKLLGIVAKNGAYVCRIKGDPARAGTAKLHHTKFSDHHIEACTFVPEGLLTTSETRDMFLFTDEEFHPGKKGHQ